MTDNLGRLLRPRSIAMIGASERSSSLGRIMMENLSSAGFGGPIYPINPHYTEVFGIRAYRRCGERARDSRPRDRRDAGCGRSRGRGRDLAARGVGGALIITAGFEGAGREAPASGATSGGAADVSAYPRSEHARHARPADRAQRELRALDAAAGRDRVSSRNPARSRRRCSTGPCARGVGFSHSCRSATWRTSTSATCSTTSPPTADDVQSCSMSKRSLSRGSSCPPHARRRVPNP